MNADPVSTIQRLLTTEPGYHNAHFLKQSRDFFESDWTPGEMESIEAEYARDFREVAAKLEAVLGKPDFIGHIEDSQFADFGTVEEVCYWRKGELVAMVWWEHQDKEAPVALGVGVLTIDEMQE